MFERGKELERGFIIKSLLVPLFQRGKPGRSVLTYAGELEGAPAPSSFSSPFPLVKGRGYRG